MQPQHCSSLPPLRGLLIFLFGSTSHLTRDDHGLLSFFRRSLAFSWAEYWFAAVLFVRREWRWWWIQVQWVRSTIDLFPRKRSRPTRVLCCANSTLPDVSKIGHVQPIVTFIFFFLPKENVNFIIMIYVNPCLWRMTSEICAEA
jgi:hypothetical protein